MQFNLADRGNTDFRGKVLRGALSPATLCLMPPQDMASEVRGVPSLTPRTCHPARHAVPHAAAGHGLQGGGHFLSTAYPCAPANIACCPEHALVL